MVSLILDVSHFINNPKLKSKPREKEIPKLKKNSNINLKKKKEEKPTKKKINPNLS